MRVIAGKNRGRRIAAPPGLGTRPATARVRASIFSRIASRRALEGAQVLDLFAGSGSLGLEALSRGAARVVFVDSSRAAVAAIRRNLDQLGMTAQAELMLTSYDRALQALGAARARFDLVFVDPPFALDCAGAALAKIVRQELLNADGIAMVRRFHRAQPLTVDRLECVNQAKLGDHRIALYRRSAQAAATVDAGPHGE